MNKIFLCILLSIYCNASLCGDDKNASLNQYTIAALPYEVLTKIILPIYVNYDYPRDFTRLALVSKKFYEIINSKDFKHNAEIQGFKNPIMVFRELSKKKKKDVNFLTKDIPADHKGGLWDIEWSIHKNGAQFFYIDPQNMCVQEPFNGFFYQKKKIYCALWINPAKQYTEYSVWNDNDHLLYTIFKSGHSSSWKAMYRTEQKVDNGRCVDSRNIHKIEGKSLPDYIHLNGKNKRTKVYVPAPVQPSQLVKKLPSTYTFEKVVSPIEEMYH